MVSIVFAGLIVAINHGFGLLGFFTQGF